MPSYSTQTLELLSRSGSRRTCAFQSPMRKSKSREPSRCGSSAGLSAVCARDATQNMTQIKSGASLENSIRIILSTWWMRGRDFVCKYRPPPRSLREGGEGERLNDGGSPHKTRDRGDHCRQRFSDCRKP